MVRVLSCKVQILAYTMFPYQVVGEIPDTVLNWAVFVLPSLNCGGLLFCLILVNKQRVLTGHTTLKGVQYNYIHKGGASVKRLDLRVTEPQHKWLEKMAEKLGIGKSEFIRRILDKEMKKK